MPTNVPNFNILASSIRFEDMKGVPK